MTTSIDACAGRPVRPAAARSLKSTMSATGMRTCTALTAAASTSIAAATSKMSTFSAIRRICPRIRCEKTTFHERARCTQVTCACCTSHQLLCRITRALILMCPVSANGNSSIFSLTACLTININDLGPCPSCCDLDEQREVLCHQDTRHQMVIFLCVFRPYLRFPVMKKPVISNISRFPCILKKKKLAHFL